MDEIEDTKEKIDQNLDVYSKAIHRSPLYHSKQEKWKENCQKAQRDCQYFIDTLKVQINKLPSLAASKHVGPLKTYQERIKKLKQQYVKKLSGQSSITQPLIQEEQHNENKLIQQKINEGNNAQQRIFIALDSMDKTVQEGIALSAEINLKLNQQIQQLDRMKDKVKDTGSTLKRAQKSINYFIKALQCDKIMLLLLLMVVLALIALIALLVKKGQK